MEEELVKNKVLRLKQDFVLRKDIDRCVIYPVSYPLRETPFEYMVLHLKQAILLSLFDGTSTVREVIKKIEYLFNVIDPVEKKKLKEYVLNFVRNHFILFEEVTTNSKSKTVHYSPEEFIIPRGKIDLTPFFLKIPIKALFIPTLKCTQNCVYCYANTAVRNEFLPIEKWFEIIEECKALKFSEISISGGEVFSYPYVFKLLKKIKDCGFNIQVPTKKLLSYGELKHLRKIGYDFFQLSIDTLEPELLDKIVGVRGYHEKLPKFFKSIKELNFKLAIVCVVTSLNVKSIPSLIEKLCEKEIVISINCTHYGRSQYKHREEFFISEDEEKWLREKIFFLQEKFPHIRITLGGDKDVCKMTENEKKERWENRAKCSAGFYAMVILPDGKVTICEELYYHPEFIIGDVKRKSILEVWHSPKAALLRKYPKEKLSNESACKFCKEFEYCYWVKGKCWKRAILYYKKFDYPDPLCPFAPTLTD